MKKLLVFTIMLMITVCAIAQPSGKTPNPTIGGKSTGTIITKAQLVAAGKIELSHNGKKVISFMLTYMNKHQRVEFNSNSDQLTQEMKNAINALPSGTTIQFTKISCKPINNPNAAPERVGDLTLTVQ